MGNLNSGVKSVKVSLAAASCAAASMPEKRKKFGLSVSVDITKHIVKHLG